jgi:prolyl-tRNA synthetase
MVCRHFAFVHGEMGPCLKRIVRMKHNETQCLANDNISLLGFSAVWRLATKTRNEREGSEMAGADSHCLSTLSVGRRSSIRGNAVRMGCRRRGCNTATCGVAACGRAMEKGTRSTDTTLSFCSCA